MMLDRWRRMQNARRAAEHTVGGEARKLVDNLSLEVIERARAGYEYPVEQSGVTYVVRIDLLEDLGSEVHVGVSCWSTESLWSEMFPASTSVIVPTPSDG